MSKKVKVAITLFIFILCIILTKQSIAAGLNITAATHTDPSTGKEELLPQGIVATASNAMGGIFCLQKGGPLRFSPEPEDLPDSGPNYNYYHTVLGCNQQNNGQLVNASELQTRKEQTKSGIASAMTNYLAKLPDKAKIKNARGIWNQYGTEKDFGTFSGLTTLNGIDIPSGCTLSIINPNNEPIIYAKTADYTPSGSPVINTNDYISYLLSSGSWSGSSPANGATANGVALKQGNYQKTVSDSTNAQLIQDAIWYDKGGLNQGKNYSAPQTAIQLLQEAKDYGNKANELTNYQASFGQTTPKVIVNQNMGTYTIGPYVVKYPSDTRFSYIQDIYVVDSNGSKVATTVITAGGNYPLPGETFFLQFNASSVVNPSYVSVKVEFGYLASTQSNYQKYTGKGEIWAYVGYIISGDSSHTQTVQDGYQNKIDPQTGKVVTGSDGKPVQEPKFKQERCDHLTIGNGYKNQKVGTYSSQILMYVANISREWKAKTITSPNSIYLGMELGGIVWEDSNSGKESVANGIIDSTEQKIPNVIVNLYNQNNQLVQTTKTDTNGKYTFKDLNAMDRYYVTFTYNGQYYEPTTYTSPDDNTNGWGKGNWSNNSNATDIRTQRTDYNSRFANIGSAPENYTGVDGRKNETFTKNELLGLTLDSNGQYVKTKEPVIDNFGNLIVENSNNSTTQKMIQFVKDSQMTASTGIGTGAYDFYPYPQQFTINSAPVGSGLAPNYEGLYPSAYYINLGLHPRQEADLAIKKDIEKVTLEINGQTQEYTYNTLENKEDADKTWDISVRLSDAYYNTNYSREIYASDYLYKVSNYGADFAKYGKDKSSELEVYVTYKIMVRNQSLSTRIKVNELVDYYDKDYEYIDARSYIILNNNRLVVNMQANSIYGASTETSIDGYNKLYVEGLNGTYLKAGQTAYVYLTFKVGKDTKDNESWLKLDEDLQSQATIGVGKENIVEINGYSTQYAPGTQVPNVGDVGETPAGIIDRDSKPGNINPQDVPKDGTIKYQNFEDDTDKAPNLRLKLYRDDNANRVISGVVWEDERTQTIEATTTGDGIKQDNEKRINGVTVQLVEVMANGTEFIWKTFEEGSGMVASTAPVINSNGIVANYNFPANHAGAYAFKSFIPGKYIVRFIYGDSEKTVLTNTDNEVNKALGKKGQNEKSYNGQDYKSTIYQSGITQNNTYAWRANSTWNLGQEKLGEVQKEISTFKVDALQNNKGAYLDDTFQNNTGSYLYDTTASDTKNNVSDAKDMASERNKVVNYSKGEMTNEKAEVLSSFRDLPTYAGKGYTKDEIQKLITELIENTKMRAETGVIVMEIEYNRNQTGNQVVDNKSSYTVSNVDLGLEERPKAQIAIDKKVTHVKLTLANGTILFDAQGPTTNVLWKEHKPYSNNETLMDPAKFGTLANIRKLNVSRVGLIQLSMDEELMHGATIQINYSIRAGNIGEVDYEDNLFYYTGKVGDKTKVTKAKATQVVDYIANNLQFNANDNDNANWTLTNKDELINSGLINKKLESAVEKYNTILITDKLNEYLVPTVYKEKVNNSAKDTTDSISLVLTQVITPENDTDDLSYRNIVEIVKASNTIGRRNEFSVVGNQDPTLEPQEIDTDRAEVVKILPPFGNAGIYIMIAIVTIIVAGIVVSGVIFIKKKVLHK